MKKILFTLILLSALVLFSFKDYGVCSGTSGQKALTCGSCHGGSISDDVFIIDGKTENEESNGVPTSTFSGGIIVRGIVGFQNLQVMVRQISKKPVGGLLLVDRKIPLVSNAGVELSSPLVLVQKKSTNAATTIPIEIRFDENLTEPQNYFVEIVLSNADGTANGDKVLAQEIVVYPAAKNEEETPSISATNCMADEESFYANNTIISLVYDEAPIDLLVYNLMGQQVVHHTFQNSSSIDVSNLPTGKYFVKQIQNGKEIVNYSFAK